MSNKSTETNNPDSLSLLKEHMSSIESEIYFLRDGLRVKNDLIKLSISSKLTENLVLIQASGTIDPENPLKEIQKEKKCK